MTERVHPEEYFRTAGRLGMKPGLERIAALLELLGRPHERFRAIHVAGSNGKGSTAAFIAAALASAGLRVGLFTSPHLQRYNERIRVNGEPVSDGELAALVERVRPLAERIAPAVGHPTEFEQGTAMAMLHFAEAGVDYAVLETGLGGRLDATNVVDPVLAVITPITIDHAEILGPTLAAIAGEKAGIIKPHRPVVLAPQQAEAMEVLLARARSCAAPVAAVVPDGVPGPEGARLYRYRPLAWGLDGGTVEVAPPDAAPRRYHVGMLGPFQLQNAAVAAAAVHELFAAEARLREEHVARSLEQTRVAGRLEVVGEAPTVILDGAHNALGAEALADALAKLYPGRPITLVCGISKDKPAEAMLRSLVPVAARVVTTEAASSRLGGWPAEELAALARSIGRADATPVRPAEAALRFALENTPPDGVVCVAGSLYLVGEVRSVVALPCAANRSPS